MDPIRDLYIRVISSVEMTVRHAESVWRALLRVSSRLSSGSDSGSWSGTGSPGVSRAGDSVGVSGLGALLLGSFMFSRE